MDVVNAKDKFDDGDSQFIMSPVYPKYYVGGRRYVDLLSAICIPCSILEHFYNFVNMQ